MEIFDLFAAIGGFALLGFFLELSISLYQRENLINK
tara:strand:- start:277 stop:384 length:108 start_codon:yes stop_codon:yes gene_type:complete